MVLWHIYRAARRRDPTVNSYLRSPALAPGASVDVQGSTGNITSSTNVSYSSWEGEEPTRRNW
jgi:hypothetical protein